MVKLNFNGDSWSAHNILNWSYKYWSYYWHNPHGYCNSLYCFMLAKKKSVSSSLKSVVCYSKIQYCN